MDFQQWSNNFKMVIFVKLAQKGNGVYYHKWASKISI